MCICISKNFGCHCRHIHPVSALKKHTYIYNWPYIYTYTITIKYCIVRIFSYLLIFICILNVIYSTIAT